MSELDTLNLYQISLIVLSPLLDWAQQQEYLKLKTQIWFYQSPSGLIEELITISEFK